MIKSLEVGHSKVRFKPRRIAFSLLIHDYQIT